MSASEKLRALDVAMTPAPWTLSRSDYEAVPYFVWDYYLEDKDADGVVALRNVLPQIVAVVEAVENRNALRGDLDRALAALDEALKC